MRLNNGKLKAMCAFGFLLSATATVFAETTPADIDSRISKIESSTAAAQSAGDNSWMLACAALVLMMTGPGLALFYGGLVQRKESFWVCNTGVGFHHVVK